MSVLAWRLNDQVGGDGYLIGHERASVSAGASVMRGRGGAGGLGEGIGVAARGRT